MSHEKDLPCLTARQRGEDKPGLHLNSQFSKGTREDKGTREMDDLIEIEGINFPWALEKS